MAERVEEETQGLLNKEKEKMSLPLSLSFKNISYTAKESPILKGVSGKVEKGHFLSIMGPSGAGKTSLLDVLAARQKVGKVSGEVYADGIPVQEGPSLSAFRSRAAYVFQDEVFIANLTVKETIMFYYELKRGAGKDSREKMRIVRAIVDVLGLRKVINTRVGNQETRGLSGGERKRLNIASEMVTSPGIMFIDEPTSGLSSLFSPLFLSLPLFFSFLSHALITR